MIMFEATVVYRTTKKVQKPNQMSCSDFENVLERVKLKSEHHASDESCQE